MLSAAVVIGVLSVNIARYFFLVQTSSEFSILILVLFGSKFVIKKKVPEDMEKTHLVQ